MTTIAQVASTMQEILGPVADRAAQRDRLRPAPVEADGGRLRPDAGLRLAGPAPGQPGAIGPDGSHRRRAHHAAGAGRALHAGRGRLPARGAGARGPRGHHAPTRWPSRSCGASPRSPSRTAPSSACPPRWARLWPGCGGSTPTSGAAALKLSVQLDLLHGTLTGPHLETGRTSDRATAVADARLARRQPAPDRPGLLQHRGPGARWATSRSAGCRRCRGTSPSSRPTTGAGSCCRLLECRCQPTLDLPVRLGVRHRVAGALAGRTGARGRGRAAAAAPAGRCPAQGGAVSPTTLALCAWTVVRDQRARRPA